LRKIKWLNSRLKLALTLMSGTSKMFTVLLLVQIGLLDPVHQQA